MTTYHSLNSLTLGYLIILLSLNISVACKIPTYAWFHMYSDKAEDAESAI